VFSAALLCRLFLISLCSNDIFVSLTAVFIPRKEKKETPEKKILHFFAKYLLQR